MTGILRRISELIRGPQAPSLNHPVFGEISLRKGKRGPYWMHEAYASGELTVSIETRGTEPPSEAQVDFYRGLIADWDATFARVAELVVPRYEQYLRQSFPPKWQSAFVPAGVGVPIDGKNDQPWDLTLECITNNSGCLFTCHFEKGRPAGVSVDT